MAEKQIIVRPPSEIVPLNYAQMTEVPLGKEGFLPVPVVMRTVAPLLAQVKLDVEHQQMIAYGITHADAQTFNALLTAIHNNPPTFEVGSKDKHIQLPDELLKIRTQVANILGVLPDHRKQVVESLKRHPAVSSRIDEYRELIKKNTGQEPEVTIDEWILLTLSNLTVSTPLDPQYPQQIIEAHNLYGDLADAIDKDMVSKLPHEEVERFTQLGQSLLKRKKSLEIDFQVAVGGQERQFDTPEKEYQGRIAVLDNLILIHEAIATQSAASKEKESTLKRVYSTFEHELSMLMQSFPGDEPLLYKRYGEVAANMVPRGKYSERWIVFSGGERYLEPSEERHHDSE